jgi:hypothetical protein
VKKVANVISCDASKRIDLVENILKWTSSWKKKGPLLHMPNKEEYQHTGWKYWCDSEWLKAAKWLRNLLWDLKDITCISNITENSHDIRNDSYTTSSFEQCRQNFITTIVVFIPSGLLLAGAQTHHFVFQTR